jgi:hypothetical protein
MKQCEMLTKNGRGPQCWKPAVIEYRTTAKPKKEDDFTTSAVCLCKEHIFVFQRRLRSSRQVHTVHGAFERMKHFNTWIGMSSPVIEEPAPAPDHNRQDAIAWEMNVSIIANYTYEDGKPILPATA